MLSIFWVLLSVRRSQIGADLLNGGLDLSLVISQHRKCVYHSQIAYPGFIQ